MGEGRKDRLGHDTSFWRRTQPWETYVFHRTCRQIRPRHYSPYRRGRALEPYRDRNVFCHCIERGNIKYRRGKHGYPDSDCDSEGDGGAGRAAGARGVSWSEFRIYAACFNPSERPSIRKRACSDTYNGKKGDYIRYRRVCYNNGIPHGFVSYFRVGVV